MRYIGDMLGARHALTRARDRDLPQISRQPHKHSATSTYLLTLADIAAALVGIAAMPWIPVKVACRCSAQRERNNAH
jgi:hypothetical protein